MDNELHRGGGSVKRARQRARAGMEPQPPGVGDEPIPMQMPRRFPGPVDRPQYPQYSIQAGRKTPAAPIRPGQSPARNNSPTRNNPVGRGPPPQRPPRPNFVPSMPSQSLGQPQANYWEDNYTALPGRDGNSSISSGPSTSSSSASIPDFPVPAIPVPLPQPQPRRAANLGPPPSSRKGGANYYPQNTFVAPIPEEQSEAHNSFASSHVMPTSWGEGPPEYYPGRGINEGDGGFVEPLAGENGQHSRASDHEDSSGFVRKVSIGKPGRPALMTVKSGESAEESDENHLQPGPFDDQQEISDGRGGGATFLSASSVKNSPAGTPNELPNGLSRTAPSPEARSPTFSLDPRVTEILGGLEKGGALDSSGTASPITSTAPSMSEKGLKRPPPLNVEAAQAGETRGSSTSLPELIRRATRLASNLDRGRTASRVGMLNILNDRAEKSGHGSRTGSISEMLNAFPSPSVQTPNGERNGSRWPSPLSKSALSRNQTFTPGSPTQGYPKSNTRRCCGMPVWAFVLLCIILLLLIAAAVVIPVTLVVLPKQHSNSGVTDLASCKKAVACANGGTNYFVSNSCRCICANGYTGAACTTATDSGCITSDVKAGDQTNNVYTNATVGSSISRLLSGGPSNYSIPLTPAILLSIFSNANLSCTSENALVNFNKQSQRRDELPLPYDLPQLNPVDNRPLSESLPTPTIEPYLHPRAADAPVATDSASVPPSQTAIPAAITSNSIIFAASSNAPSATGTASAPTSSTSSSPGTHPITQQILDFARVAVLFIYQETSLTSAVLAQSSLQQALFDASSFNASKTAVGGGVVVDFGKFTVDLGNGTLYGGGNGGGG